MRNLFRFFGINTLDGKASSRSDVNLDEHLREALNSRSLQKITTALEKWCIEGTSRTDWLMELLRSMDYSKTEVAKINILSCFYKKEYAETLQLIDEYLSAHGFDEDLCVIKLVAHYLDGQMELAYYYMKSVESKHMAYCERSDYWQMRAGILWAMNYFEELGFATDKAVELSQNNREVLETALSIYIEMDDKSRIRATLELIEKSNEVAGFAHALNLLALSRYKEGFETMEARYDNKEAHRYLNVALFDRPRWLGKPIDGLRLLISAEQGLGDTVQMARYLSLTSSFNCENICVEVQPELIELIRYNYPEFKISERVFGITPDDSFDVWVGMMSLPLMTGRYGIATPLIDGYLRAPRDNAVYWRARIQEMTSTKAFKIGVAWSGQSSHRADRRRSIPYEVMMNNLIRNSHASFFTLQTNVPEVCPENMHNTSDELMTMSDTAALIEQMDLVITVDTSVAHLAGALGKETWLLLPKCYEWRWGHAGEKNYWYSSVKVLRQERHGQWAPLLAEVSDRRLPEKLNSMENL